MTSLQDYLQQCFHSGVVRLNASVHVTPEGTVKFRLESKDDGREFECLVTNNNLKVIENA